MVKKNLQLSVLNPLFLEEQDHVQGLLEATAREAAFEDDRDPHQVALVMKQAPEGVGAEGGSP